MDAEEQSDVRAVRIMRMLLGEGFTVRIEVHNNGRDDMYQTTLERQGRVIRTCNHGTIYGAMAESRILVGLAHVLGYWQW